jgi:uncharacterized repeat protein (TIGR01451 family)
MFILPFVGAMAALTLMLTTISQARDALPTGGVSAPSIRPHDPSSGVYTMYDSLTPADMPTATYQWVEIRDSADYVWNVGAGDHNDVSPDFPIGFFFPFYDDFYTHLRVSEKGYIFFEKSGEYVGPGNGIPGEIPHGEIGPDDAINNFIAPFAGDLVGHPSISRIYVRNDSNPRRTIIEFENMIWCCNLLYNPRIFQIILYPEGRIDMQYLKITNFAGDLDQNRPIRVGLENLDGSAGDVYTQGLFIPDAADFWQDEMMIRFQPNFTDVQAIFLPPVASIWDDPGNTITTSAFLYLGADEQVTRSFTLTHSLVVSSSVPTASWESGIITYPTFAVVTGTYSSTLPVVVRVPPDVTNVNDMATLTITAESFDLTPAISATFTLNYGPAHRDLQILKTLDPDVPPALHGAFRYRLTITNTDYNGSDRAAVAHGVVVTDILVPGITYEDCRRTYYWRGCGSMVTTATIGSQTMITLDLGTMYVNEVETLWLELRNEQYVAGEIVGNTAHVTTTENVELGDGPNNHSFVAFTVASPPTTSLVINKDYWYDNDYVAAGQAIPYYIRFYNGNAGNVQLLQDATIVDLLPENTTFNRAQLYYDGPELEPAEGPITPTISGPMNRTLTFDIPFVDNGWWNSGWLEIWVNIPPTIPLGTRLANAVTITHPSTPYPASDVEWVEIASQYVDPFVDKEPSRDGQGNLIRPAPGQDYTYWIDYGNNSVLADAPNVIITDTLPPSVTLVSVSAAAYLTGPVTSALPGGIVQLTWYTDTAPGVPRSQRDRIAVVVHIDEDVRPGTILVNRVAITYTGPYTFSPSTTADDTDVVTIEVASDLERSQKLVDNPIPDAGDSVEYTLFVSNTNPANAVSFALTDVLPLGLLAYASHYTPTTGMVVTGPHSILWTGVVSPTSEESLAFRATVTDVAYAGQIIKNTAYISSGNIYLARSRAITVARGAFDGSDKTVSAATAIGSGDSITYTITARNDGSTSRVVTITDMLPPSVTLVSGSFSATTGTAVLPPGSLRFFAWAINVDGMSRESLSFQVTVTDGLTTGVTITNVAYLDDGFSPIPLPLVETFTIGRLPGEFIYLPVVLRNY